MSNEFRVKKGLIVDGDATINNLAGNENEVVTVDANGTMQTTDVVIDGRYVDNAEIGFNTPRDSNFLQVYATGLDLGIGAISAGASEISDVTVTGLAGNPDEIVTLANDGTLQKSDVTISSAYTTTGIDATNPYSYTIETDSGNYSIQMLEAGGAVNISDLLPTFTLYIGNDSGASESANLLFGGVDTGYDIEDGKIYKVDGDEIEGVTYFVEVASYLRSDASANQVVRGSDRKMQGEFQYLTAYGLAGNTDEIVTLDSNGKLVASGDTISSLLTSYDTRFVNITGDTMTGNLTVDADVTITGNLYVNGTETIVNTTSVSASDNLIVINAGETGAGVTAGTAGIEVDRGSATNYQFMFRESDDTFVVGEVGNLVALAGREDSPTNTRVPYWDSTSSTFKTDGNVTIASGGNVTVGGTTNSNGGLVAQSNALSRPNTSHASVSVNAATAYWDGAATNATVGDIPSIYRAASHSFQIGTVTKLQINSGGNLILTGDVTADEYYFTAGGRIGTDTNNYYMALPDATSQFLWQSHDYGTTLATLDTNGDLEVTGDITADGITFGDSTLSDYVSSTFTPSLVDLGGGATFTASIANGFYTRIGSMVHVQGVFVVNGVTGTASGGLRISGLPVSANSTNNSLLNIYVTNGLSWTGGVTGIINVSSSVLDLFKNVSNANFDRFNADEIQSGTYVYFSGTYQT